MNLRKDKAPAYEEIADIPEIVDDIKRHRMSYKRLTGKDTELSNEDILNMIAWSDDDKDDGDWVNEMLEMEKLPVPA